MFVTVRINKPSDTNTKHLNALLSRAVELLCDVTSSTSALRFVLVGPPLEMSHDYEGMPHPLSHMTSLLEWRESRLHAQIVLTLSILVWVE